MERPACKDKEGCRAHLREAPIILLVGSSPSSLLTSCAVQGDRFEEMVRHEEDIRLGDEGWKERYYQVSVLAAADVA